MRLRTFQRKDCGSTAESFSNTCFYNCLHEELKRLNIPYHFGLTYSKFIQLGEWTQDQKGKMIDTCEHEAQIQLFAQKLGLRIRVYTEISPGIVNSDMFMEFGVIDPLDNDYIRIVKLANAPHFNVLEWISDETQEQIAADALLAQKIQETPTPELSRENSPNINSKDKELERLRETELLEHYNKFRHRIGTLEPAPSLTPRAPILRVPQVASAPIRELPKPENSPSYLRYTELMLESAKTLEQFGRNIELANRNVDKVKEDLDMMQNNMEKIIQELEKDIPDKIKHLKTENFVLQVLLCIAACLLYIWNFK